MFKELSAKSHIAGRLSAMVPQGNILLIQKEAK